MEHLAEIVFLLNLAWMMTHELDAIQQHEWRVLPLTRWMVDAWGYRIFVLAHIPLFVLCMAFRDSIEFQIALDAFFIIHIGLHWLFRNHPEYTFDNWLSQLLIVGVAPLAILHLVLIL